MRTLEHAVEAGNARTLTVRESVLARLRLLDHVREALRGRRYRRSTEEAPVGNRGLAGVRSPADRMFKP